MHARLEQTAPLFGVRRRRRDLRRTKFGGDARGTSPIGRYGLVTTVVDDVPVGE